MSKPIQIAISDTPESDGMAPSERTVVLLDDGRIFHLLVQYDTDTGEEFARVWTELTGPWMDEELISESLPESVPHV